MTLTAPGCGMGPTIAADAQSRIMTIEDMDDAAVELVWEPAWNQGMISIEGKMKLGMIWNRARARNVLRCAFG